MAGVVAAAGRPVGEGAGDEPQDGGDGQADLGDEATGQQSHRNGSQSGRQDAAEQVGAADRAVNPPARADGRDELERAEDEGDAGGEDVDDEHGVVGLAADVQAAVVDVQQQVRAYEDRADDGGDDEHHPDRAGLPRGGDG